MAAMRAAMCSSHPSAHRLGEKGPGAACPAETIPALVCQLLGTRHGLDLLDLSSASASRVSEGFQVHCTAVMLGATGNVPLGKGQLVQLSSWVPAWRTRSCCGWAPSGALLLAHPSPGGFAHLREATVLVSDCSVFHRPFPHSSFLAAGTTETLCPDFPGSAEHQRAGLPPGRRAIWRAAGTAEDITS